MDDRLRPVLTPGFVRTLILDLVVMVLSLSVHEYAHAWVAHRLGDDTAEREGRLSLSPVTHVDPIGTLLVPAVALYFGGFGFFGWARPVPVSPNRFTRRVSMRTGMALVAAAGPLSNFLLAAVTLALYGVLDRAGVSLHAGSHPTAVGTLLAQMFQLNVALMIFNFLPIPPLDGSRLLPRSFDGLMQQLAPVSALLLIAVISAPSLRAWLFDAPYHVVAGALETVFRTRIPFT